MLCLAISSVERSFGSAIEGGIHKDRRRIGEIVHRKEDHFRKEHGSERRCTGRRKKQNIEASCFFFSVDDLGASAPLEQLCGVFPAPLAVLRAMWDVSGEQQMGCALQSET